MKKTSINFGMNTMMEMKKNKAKKTMKKKNQINIMKIILIKTINIIIPMIIMVTKKIIHMVQGNIGKRKEINTNMMDI